MSSNLRNVPEALFHLEDRSVLLINPQLFISLTEQQGDRAGYGRYGL